jgi:RNA polymerase sigma-70 factor, ECF subfamily
VDPGGRRATGIADASVGHLGARIVPMAGTFMTAADMTGGKIPPEYRDEIEDCFKSRSGSVHGFLRRFTRDNELSEDVVQETFRKAAQNWRELRRLTETERTAWLIRVAFNTAADILRRSETARKMRPQVRDRYFPTETDVHRQAMTSIAVQHFIEETGKMPPQRHRAAFLHWRCGWTIQEIAEEMGITASAVSQHIKAAREVLAKELRPYIPPELGPAEEVPDHDA